MRKLVLAAMAAILGGVAGCGQSSDHPSNFHFEGGTGLVGGGGGGGLAGSGGAAGADAAPCDPDASAGTNMAGNLVVYDPLFSAAGPTPFGGKARLTMQGALCVWVETTYDASGPLDDAGKNYFHLNNVKTDNPAWTHIYQQDGGTEAVYPTLIPVNASVDQTIDGGFGFMSSTEIDKIYTASAVTRDPTKGTLVVQLRDAKFGSPISGGTVSSVLTGTNAYAQSGAWSTAGPTDDTGVVLILNIEAPPFPGKSTTVHAVTSAFTDDYICAVEAGAVTICWIGIGF